MEEINRLLKAQSNNKKVDNTYEVAERIITLDFESGSEIIFELLELADMSLKGDLLALVIITKQKDLHEKHIVRLLNIVLTHFGSISFSVKEKSIHTQYASSILNKEEIIPSFALLTAIFTLSKTKSTLIKELRKNPIMKMDNLLQVILILLSHHSIIPIQNDTYIPSFEQLCEWVEILLDAYYLNFCLKDDQKDMLEKIDDEIEAKSQFYEQSKAFADSLNAYSKCSENIKKSLNKTESQFYVQSIYL